jgi:exosortase/archaeosortase family protein
MKNMKKELTGLAIRYLVMVLVALPNLWLFYTIFTPLTIYPTYFLLNLFFDVTLSGNILTIMSSSNYFPIEIVSACVAGSAYYLLLILNLSTPNILIKRRLKIIGESFLILLILNILRIFLLSILHVSGSDLFNITHQVFWYLANILFVVGTWFLMVRNYKIKEIPFYSDIRFLTGLKKKTKKSKHSKKNK